MPSEIKGVETVVGLHQTRNERHVATAMIADPVNKDDQSSGPPFRQPFAVEQLESANALKRTLSVVHIAYLAIAGLRTSSPF